MLTVPVVPRGAHLQGERQQIEPFGFLHRLSGSVKGGTPWAFGLSPQKSERGVKWLETLGNPPLGPGIYV